MRFSKRKSGVIEQHVTKNDGHTWSLTVILSPMGLLPIDTILSTILETVRR